MGDVFAVLPFVNDAAIVTVTADQVWAIAEHGLGALPAAKGAFPQIAGFKATFDSTAPALTATSEAPTARWLLASANRA